MDENNLEKLRELVEFLKANEIAEFETERAEGKLRIKFASAVAAAGFDADQLARLMASAAPVSAAPVAAAGAAPVAAGAPEVSLHKVKSPIVGTFYESPSPGSAPFVKVGDVVEVGQVLCIVEAMKLMNEIESDAAGEIVERIAASGQPVEYGQPLFAIKAK
ncbi:MAG TPA: acetyl-CoA carboxylase biotin carboxyl carrier protein [Granulicella sp.]|jgi:acetyl-CoA carboxylase biotin carboxyl carrier protein|nr:acetyl-CoA carboxylase biotin carboxyl carrier protein [Granulicella sp.]